MNQDVPVSEAVVLLLEGNSVANTESFLTVVDDAATREVAQTVVDEAAAHPIDRDSKTLAEVAAGVRHGRRRRHPDLSEDALRRLGNDIASLVT